MIKPAIKSVFGLFILAMIFLAPFSILAQGEGLVPCGTESYPKGSKDSTGQSNEFKVINPCGYKHFFDLVNNIVNFALVVIALPLAGIMFAWAGFLFIFSGIQPEQRSKAKGIFWNVVIGFFVAIAAWLIIHTILLILGYKGSWIGF